MATQRGLPQGAVVTAAAAAGLPVAAAGRPAAAGEVPAAAAVVWQPPIRMDKGQKEKPGVAQPAAAAVGREQGAAAAGGLELDAAPGAFLPAQYRQLHVLLHQHTQMLMQVGGGGRGFSQGDQLASCMAWWLGGLWR